MKLILISGHTRGLGRALVEALSVNPGYLVVGVSRSLAKLPHSYLQWQVDLSEDTSRWSQEFKDWFTVGGADLEVDEVFFISNAAIIDPIHHVLSLDLEQLERSFRVNVLSAIQLAKLSLTLSRRLGVGLTIANVDTGASSRPIPSWSAYCTTKAAIKMAFEVMAAENPDVRVKHIDPGVIDTEMQGKIREAADVFDNLKPFKDLKVSGGLQSPSNAASDFLKKLFDEDCPAQ